VHCIFCGEQDTKVVDSRLVADGSQVRRRRECLACKARVTTYERIESVMPKVIKQDGSRMPFSEEKLRAGISKALEKRPVGTEHVEGAVQRIIQQIHGQGDREVSSRRIGEMVMKSLRGLDQVAYVRFASVYRSFQDIAEFRKEIDLLEKREEFSKEGRQVHVIAETADELLV